MQVGDVRMLDLNVGFGSGTDCEALAFRDVTRSRLSSRKLPVKGRQGCCRWFSGGLHLCSTPPKRPIQGVKIKFQQIADNSA
jgi:hypothetical protein